MVGLFTLLGLLILFVFLFFWQDKKDRANAIEQDRLGDEHIMREIEKFKRWKGLID